MFTDQDLIQFRSKGISPETINQQLENFRKGFPPVILESPAVSGNGIITPAAKEINEFITRYEKVCKNLEIVKFVPASGAATRMFKELFTFLEKSDKGLSQQVLVNESEFLSEFVSKIESFAFSGDIEKILKNHGTTVIELINMGNISELVKSILDRSGLGYGNLPKGLIKFHRYGTYTRTAFEEHMVEGADYSLSKNNQVKLHLTVSPEFREAFLTHYRSKKKEYEDNFKIKFQVGFSIQRPSTDIIAVNLENFPFRNENGEILFRPGGHGALLENLNEIDSDIIFIKNIDNISPDRVKKNTSKFKKLLAGILLDFQSKIFSYERIIEEENPGFEKLREICGFLGQGGCRFNKKDMEGFSEGSVRELLLSKLRRPVRVCGMVKNEGEPGGGPFWVLDERNNSSLQIVETSQIDLTDDEQKEILNNSTHFNPVDLVCGVRNRKGRKYNLLKYTDPATGFIAEKSAGGYPVKAQELPGLWNGAMANWNTLFVEVPVETFTPVKTINDLLRPEHQEI
jgi:hypothetical protein